MFVTGVWVFIFSARFSFIRKHDIKVFWGCYELGASFSPGGWGLFSSFKGGLFFAHLSFLGLSMKMTYNSSTRVSKVVLLRYKSQACKSKHKLRQILTKINYVKSSDKRPGYLINFEDFRGGNYWSEGFIKFLIDKAQYFPIGKKQNMK